MSYLFCWKEGSIKENQLNTPLIVLCWMAFDWIDDICIEVDLSSSVVVPVDTFKEFYSFAQIKRTSIFAQVNNIRSKKPGHVKTHSW